MSISQNPTAPTALPASGLSLSRPRPVATTESVAITPADIWRIIRKRILLIIITALIVNAIGIPFSFAWAKWWPRWPGVAVLEVKYAVIPDPLANREATSKDLIEVLQRNEVQALKSRQYATELLEDPKVRQTKWYLRDDADAPARFEKEIAVNPVRNSAVIEVRFHTRDPEEAPLIVNKLVDIYLDDRRQSATQDLDLELRSLRSQQTALMGDLRLKTGSLTRFVESENIPVVTMMNTEAAAELQRLAADRSNLEMQNVGLSAALEILGQQTPETWIPGSMQAYRIDNDPAIRTIRAYLLDLEEQREVQRKRLGPDHLFLRRLDDSIRVAKRDLQKKLAEIRLQVFTETLQEYQNSLASNEQILDQIQTAMEQARAQQNELNPKILDYLARQEDIEALKKYIAVLDGRISTTVAKIDQQRQNVSAQVVRRALASPAPERSSPRLIVNIPGTIFLSIILGIGLAFMLEYLDKSVRSSQDIRRHTALTFLGSIPALHEDEANPEDMYSVVVRAPRSLLAESFRQLRTNLLFYCSRDNSRSILLTSPSPQDGRTSTAINLATSIALSGRKVLLIDANFCKPALHRLYTNLPPEGFADLLMGKASIEQVIADSPVQGLSVMGNGHAPAEHTELLGGATMRELMTKLGERFDQIILDGPPALITAHALAIAGQVDGVLFVARAGKNSRGALNRMREEISRLNSHVHGVVLNAVEATSGGYLRKSYQQFYDYHYGEHASAGPMPSDGQEKTPTPPPQSS